MHRTQPAQADGEGDVSEGRHKTRFAGDFAAWAQVVAPVGDIALTRNSIGDLVSKASTVRKA